MPHTYNPSLVALSVVIAGMASMEVDAQPSYDPTFWWSSIAIAVVASFVALNLLRVLGREESARIRRDRGAAAVVMGFAIAGMHYTGMAAAHFIPNAGAPASTRHGIDPFALAALEGGGYAAEGMDDGDVALRRLSSGEEWDLIVTDVHMARVGGAELLRTVRGSVATSILPVIVLTGSAEHDSEPAMMEAGTDDYLRKPLDPPRLLARVKAVLRRVSS